MSKVTDQEIQSVLDPIWQTNTPSTEHRENTRLLYNKIYNEFPEQNGVEKRPEKTKLGGCGACFLEVKNGLRRLISDHVIKLVPEKEYRRRADICDICDDHLPNTGQCGNCLCFISLKAQIASEKCPHKSGNKWSA